MQPMEAEAQWGPQRARARLLIAAAHDLVRAGLRSLLAGEPDLEVVGEAMNGRQAITCCARLRPDLVLMDIEMPQLDGLVATGAITQQCPGTSVIIVTTHEDPNDLLEALKAGAAGYLLTGATRHEMVSTVRRVLRGETSLDPHLAMPLLRRLALGQAQPQARKDEGQGRAPAARLTPRERDVLRLVALGWTNRQIAQELIVTGSTVKAHVQHLLAKLGVPDRTAAAVHAVHLGLLSFSTAPTAAAPGASARPAPARLWDGG